jgi:alkylation response protein AidB-like acyl-CoA dehydrogenase
MMDFTFTAEQRTMAEALRRLLDEVCSPKALRASADSGRPASDRWGRLMELGLGGVLAPAAAGGMDLSDVDFVLLAEEIGRALLPEALVEHAAIAVPLLAEFAHGALAARWLQRAASGHARIAVGHEINPVVLDAAEAGALLLMHGDEVHLLERDRVTLERRASLDPLRQLSQVEWIVTPAARIGAGPPGQAAWERAALRGALYAAAQCNGLAQRMIELAVSYATQRSQFGKPIGSYQSIKHQLASAQVKVEFARALVYGAAPRVSQIGARTAALVSGAKLAAGDAADLAARTAIQVHGAMGYSWEVDIHLYAKRAWALIGAWGDRSFHARRVQSLVLGGGLALGPGRTFEALEI